jgi:hypothetical protein
VRQLTADERNKGGELAEEDTKQERGNGKKRRRGVKNGKWECAINTAHGRVRTEKSEEVEDIKTAK